MRSALFFQKANPSNFDEGGAQADFSGANGAVKRVHYGFVEIPDLPSALRAAKDLGCPLDLDTAVYFGAHDEVVRGEAGGWLLRWRVPLFAFLFRNSVRAVDLFNLPPHNFLEIGRRIEI